MPCPGSERLKKDGSILMRRGGIMVSRCFPTRVKQLRMVRAGGIEPPQALRPNGFSYHLRLSPPGRGFYAHLRQVCGLDYAKAARLPLLMRTCMSLFRTPLR